VPLPRGRVAMPIVSTVSFTVGNLPGAPLWLISPVSSISTTSTGPVFGSPCLPSHPRDDSFHGNAMASGDRGHPGAAAIDVARPGRGV
jgi:hypothetical protein